MKKYLCLLFVISILFNIDLKAEKLFGWVRNSDCQLGDSTKTDHTSPVQLGSEANWVQVVGGERNSIAIKNDGTLWAWGYNYWGQLGDGSSTNRKSPVQIGIETNWSKVACGFRHSIAIKSDGTLWAWGSNDYGQLGDGTTISRISPVQIGIEANLSKVACGSDFSFGLTTLIDDVEDSRAEMFNFKASPNPFFDEINIEFSLPFFNKISLQVYDLNGSEVSTLFEGSLEAGTHKYTLEGNNLASGEYTVILTIGKERFVRKVIRVK
ncbi:MAG: T9SS type A sorting domain-containing protein [Candidatus Kapabacteria bacterium]|nr:T9SS type A sorting domain-containing protein [Candidatus Kapabacteria bacterium]